MIRDVRREDVEAICSIYNEYVKQTVITFEQEVVSIDDMINRIEKK